MREGGKLSFSLIDRRGLGRGLFYFLEMSKVEALYVISLHFFIHAHTSKRLPTTPIRKIL
jgi:hypothetical protein